MPHRTDVDLTTIAWLGVSSGRIYLRSHDRTPGVEMRTPHDDDKWMYWLKVSKAIPGKKTT